MANTALEHSWKIPSLGETIAGKYIVDGLCGRGGLAVVLSAMHVGLAQRVAIKMLLPEWAGDPEVVERFAREGRAATRIKSEHVVRVLDVDALESGAPYLVLEYLEGHNLDEIVALWGPPPVQMAIDWVLQATEAISEAHAYGIIHRDLKPANLFLTSRADGSACIKVIDFGLSKLTDPRVCGTSAKLTRPTDVMGSPHYMAPEQLRAAGAAGPRADLWALGVVLHELLTGQPPFRGETMPELCATVLTQPPLPLRSLRPETPPEVEHAVLRCLEKEPEARFASAAELARALVAFGTESARVSCRRIERIVETGGRASVRTPLPAWSAPRPHPNSWPSDPPFSPHGNPPSARVTLGSLLIFAGIGVGAFLWVHSLVHGAETPVGSREATSLRATEPPNPPPIAVATATSPPVATSIDEPAPPPKPPAIPLATPRRGKEPASTPNARPLPPLLRPKPYRVEPGPIKASSSHLARDNPYVDPKAPAAADIHGAAAPVDTRGIAADSRGHAAHTELPAETSSPSGGTAGTPTEDPFDSRK
jgi:serine/threonine-protein kinase